MESWDLDGSSQRLRILLLTGFLGSGKTTVRNDLIQQPTQSQTSVLDNEFGGIGLDHDLVTHSKDDVVIATVDAVNSGDTLSMFTDVKAQGPEILRVASDDSELAVFEVRT